MANIILNETDFRIVGGDEKKFVAIPLSKWNAILSLISEDQRLVDELVDLDIQTVRIRLEE